jgi:hypothetical protein
MDETPRHKRTNKDVQDDLDLELIGKYEHPLKWIEPLTSNEKPVPQQCRKDLFNSRFEYSDGRERLSTLWCKDKDYVRAFSSKPAGKEGESIIEYFLFLRYLIACNFLVSIWCFIGWIPHVLKTRPLLDKEGMGWGSSTYGDLSELMFLSTYQPSSDTIWVAMVVLGTITMMMSGPLHFPFTQNCKPSHDIEEDDVIPSESITDTHIIKPDLDIIDYADKTIKVNDMTKKVTTYIILVVICCIPIGVNYGLLYVASHKALKVRLFETLPGHSSHFFHFNPAATLKANARPSAKRGGCAGLVRVRRRQVPDHARRTRWWDKRLISGGGCIHRHDGQ